MAPLQPGTIVMLGENRGPEFELIHQKGDFAWVRATCSPHHDFITTQMLRPVSSREQRKAEEAQRFETHKLWSETDTGAPRAVTEHGLAVCKVCGAGEAQLYDETCLDRLIERARQWWKTATPEQIADMFRSQRESWVRGEMGMGESSVVVRA